MLFYTHPSCLAHDPGPGHPESPARLTAVLKALESFTVLEHRATSAATREQLQRVHSSNHIEAIFSAVPEQGLRSLDPDTFMSPASLQAALHAAGAVCAAVDAIMTGPVRRAFCAVRPPGHHATRDQAMGFCLFNTIAVGAAHALSVHGIERIAIVDFDVHHGNGTQDIFWNEPRVLYASSHQWPLYPGSGRREETGAGNIINVPLPAGAGSKEFRTAYEQQIFPALRNFRPAVILISVGFDAHRLDPLANLNLETEDYHWVTEQLVAIADTHAQGRIISALEGGYNLTALSESVVAHVTALLAN